MNTNEHRVSAMFDAAFWGIYVWEIHCFDCWCLISHEFVPPSSILLNPITKETDA